MSLFSFDKQGFIFTCKVLALLVVLASGIRVGLAYFLAPSHEAEQVAVQENEDVERAITRLTGNRNDETGAEGTFAHTVRVPAIADYVPAEGLFIGVDLRTKLLTIYDDGFAVRTHDVISAPETDSASFVPTGLYTVEELAREHYSEVTKTYLPDRIRFEDRFSIHGPPYAASGTDSVLVHGVGSIGLTAEDAARLFDLVEVGTPLFVLAENADEAFGSLAALAIANHTLPAVSARSFALSDAVTGEVYLEKNARDRYPIASITKLMTALVAHETYGINEEIQTSGGDAYVIGDLYYPLFLRSSNGVAHAIAAHGDTPTFLARMNTQARALGMYQTSFADSSGLSPKNFSSARDLSLLGQYLYDRKRFLLDISSADQMTITSSRGTAWSMKNQNKMAGDPSFRGGKLGYTDEAGQTSLAVFTVPVGDEVRVLSVVVLNSRDWKQDTRTLVSWFRENASQL